MPSPLLLISIILFVFTVVPLVVRSDFFKDKCQYCGTTYSSRPQNGDNFVHCPDDDCDGILFDDGEQTYY